MDESEEGEIEETFYNFRQLEDDVIKYICEKIVAMREQPFIDAVDNLRRAQELNNLQMIMDMQKNKAKWNQNVGNQPGGAMGMTQQSVSFMGASTSQIGGAPQQ